MLSHGRLFKGPEIEKAAFRTNPGYRALFYKISGITSRLNTLAPVLDQHISWDLKFYHVRLNIGVMGSKTLNAAIVH